MGLEGSSGFIKWTQSPVRKVIPLYVNSSLKTRSLVGIRKVVTALVDSEFDACSGFATPGPAAMDEKFVVVAGTVFGNG